VKTVMGGRRGLLASTPRPAPDMSCIEKSSEVGGLMLMPVALVGQGRSANGILRGRGCREELPLFVHAKLQPCRDWGLWYLRVLVRSCLLYFLALVTLKMRLIEAVRASQTSRLFWASSLGAFRPSGPLSGDPDGTSKSDIDPRRVETTSKTRDLRVAFLSLWLYSVSYL